MATQNFTRKLGFNKKRGVAVFTATLDYTVTTDVDITTSGDTYELFVLPENAYVTKAEMLVITAFNSVTSDAADVGFDGGDTLIDGANLQSAADTLLSGGTNAVVPQFKDTGGTVTFLPTYTGGSTSAGKVTIVIEYVEIAKTNGELTNFSTT